MGIFRRVKDLSRATWHERLDNAENPLQLIQSYLAEKNQQYQETKQLYERNLLHVRTLQEQYLQAKSMADKREQQAIIALKAGEEEVAKLALEEKVLFVEKYEQYYVLYEQTRELLSQLSTQKQVLEAELHELSQKRQYYADRLQTIALQKKWLAMNMNVPQQRPAFHDSFDNRVQEELWMLEALHKLRREGR